MKTATDLVTIVIPVYNGGYFLSQAIESALSQTWPMVEVLVVNDGSEDGGHTEQVCRSFGSRIRYIRQQNGGVASALNTGISEMRGRYFSWLSHDDLYDPRKIEVQMAALLKEPGQCVVFGSYATMRDDGTILGEIDVGVDYNTEQPLWAVLEGRINGCTVLLDRELFDRHGNFDLGLPTTQDYELWWRLALHHRFVHVPGTLVRHRVHEGQGSRSRRHIEEASLLWMEMLETVPEQMAVSHAGSKFAFLLRAANFLQGTGYDGAKAGLTALLRRRAGAVSVGVVLGAGDERAAATTIAELETSGLDLRFLVVDETPAHQSSFLFQPLSSPLRRHHVISTTSNASELVVKALDVLDTPMLAFLPAGTPVDKLWGALGRLVQDENLDAVTVSTASDMNASKALGALSGLLVRRSILQTALGRTAGQPSGILHALGLSGRFALSAA